jgi:hypothetical protein
MTTKSGEGAPAAMYKPKNPRALPKKAAAAGSCGLRRPGRVGADGARVGITISLKQILWLYERYIV